MNLARRREGKMRWDKDLRAARERRTNRGRDKMDENEINVVIPPCPF